MKKLLTTLGLAAVSLAGGHAQIIEWDFNSLTGGSNNFGPSPFAATSSNANLTVGGLTRGAGVGTNGSAAARALGGNDWVAASSADAITAQDYFTFTVSANTGYTLSFSSISTFEYRRSNTGATSGLVQYQIGSGSFNDISNVSFSSNASSGASLAPIDLTGISALQNIAAGVNVTFRFVNFGGSKSAGTWYFFDVGNDAGTADLAFSGSVTAIPEPSTWVLLGLGSAFVLWRSRLVLWRSRRKAA